VKERKRVKERESKYQDFIIKNIINILEKNIAKTNINKSSHWKKYLNKEAVFKDPHNFLGFGSFTKINYKSIFHYIFQLLIFGINFFNTPSYKLYKKLFDKIKRQIDIDTVRHIFTFEKLKYLNPKRICIIGDGKLNGVLGAHLTFPKAIIFSVNLTETLINDLYILDMCEINLKHSIKLVENENDNLDDRRLYIVPSNLKNFLKDKKIDLFINIASFQEMTVDEIYNYFEIIKYEGSKLYCCNREYKKLVGGEEIYFDKYPWKGVKFKYFWENCPWHRKYYTFRPPFISSFPNTIHCLVSF